MNYRPVESLLTEDEWQTIKMVESSIFKSFSTLVEAAGLDPKRDLIGANLEGVDMRGADLRGYNFSFADLRNAIRDSDTVIDETTTFEGTRLSWIDSRQADLIQKMLHANAANDSSTRRKILEEIVVNFDSPKHIDEFLLRSIRQARSLGTLLDFAEFISDDADQWVIQEIAMNFDRLLPRPISKNQKRKVASRWGDANEIVKAMSERGGGFFAQFIDELANIISGKQKAIVSRYNQPGPITISDLVATAAQIETKTREKATHPF